VIDKAKQEIYKLLSESEEPLTIKEMEGSLPSIGKRTIWEALKTLERTKDIKAKSGKQNKLFYSLYDDEN